MSRCRLPSTEVGSDHVQTGVGASSRSRPFTSARPRIRGNRMLNQSRFCCSCSIVRVPAMKDGMAGWATTNCSAAAGSGTVCAAQTTSISRDPFHDIGGRRGIVVFGALGLAPVARIPELKPPPTTTAALALGAERQESVERVLLQQSVAARQQEAVEITLLQRSWQTSHSLTPTPIALTTPSAAKRSSAFQQPSIACPENLRLIRATREHVDVVDEADVDPLQRQPLQANPRTRASCRRSCSRIQLGTAPRRPRGRSRFPSLRAGFRARARPWRTARNRRGSSSAARVRSEAPPARARTSGRYRR